jgi:hypothetical protein
MRHGKIFDLFWDSINISLNELNPESKSLKSHAAKIDYFMDRFVSWGE